MAMVDYLAHQRRGSWLWWTTSHTSAVVHGYGGLGYLAHQQPVVHGYGGLPRTSRLALPSRGAHGYVCMVDYGYSLYSTAIPPTTPPAKTPWSMVDYTAIQYGYTPRILRMCAATSSYWRIGIPSVYVCIL